MPRKAQRRALTGCRRRGPLRNNNSNTRCIHLNTSEVAFRDHLHKCIISVEFAAFHSIRRIKKLFLLHTLWQQQRSNAKESAAIYCLLQVEKARYCSYRKILAKWFILDHRCHDISPLDEPGARNFLILPWKDLRLRDWEDIDCYFFTGFRRVQLLRIYNQFGLAKICEGTGKNYVTITNKHFNDRGVECKYRFHPEELFLFMMTRCRLGLTNKAMVNLIFGGDATRWTFGFPEMLRYLKRRYKNILESQGLLRYLKQFPAFHEAISSFVCKPKIHHENDGRTWMSPGLNTLPWPLFGFIDGSNTRTNVPFSGPAFDGHGSPRKLWYKWGNRATYTRFKMIHGIGGQSFLLPNGITFLYGPTSCRVVDITRLRMSNLDQFLREVQRDEPDEYSLLGDSPYGARWLRCIRSYIRSDRNGPPLTFYQLLCNYEFHNARQRIEFWFGDRNNIFKIMTDPSNFRLGKRHPYAVEQYWVCHLLTNIYNCLNGNKTSKCFGCSPPQLEEYLRL